MHPHTRRRWRWAARGVLLLLLLLAGDYALYPHLSRPGGVSFNRGENGLWLRYRWYFGERSDADLRRLSQHLREQQIRYAYFHVRHITRQGTLRYHNLAGARRLVAALHRDAPSVRVIAWVFAGNARLASTGIGEVNLADPAVRKAMVGEARWLVNEGGFDGVQWDYEICDGGDPDFLRLLRETRAALPRDKLLSAAVPMWLPPPFQRWGWSEAYFAQVAATCDQLAVMAYDSGIYLPRGYVWLVHQQVIHVTRAIARGNPRCRVLLGLPTYGKGGLSHHPWAENLRLALKGVREGLADSRTERSVFAGVALFADYTTQPEEWQTYWTWWLGLRGTVQQPAAGRVELLSQTTLDAAVVGRHCSSQSAVHPGAAAPGASVPDRCSPLCPDGSALRAAIRTRPRIFIRVQE